MIEASTAVPDLQVRGYGLVAPGHHRPGGRRGPGRAERGLAGRADPSGAGLPRPVCPGPSVTTSAVAGSPSGASDAASGHDNLLFLALGTGIAGASDRRRPDAGSRWVRRRDRSPARVRSPISTAPAGRTAAWRRSPRRPGWPAATSAPPVCAQRAGGGRAGPARGIRPLCRPSPSRWRAVGGAGRVRGAAGSRAGHHRRGPVRRCRPDHGRAHAGTRRSTLLPPQTSAGHGHPRLGRRGAAAPDCSAGTT